MKLSYFLNLMIFIDLDNKKSKSNITDNLTGLLRPPFKKYGFLNHLLILQMVSKKLLHTKQSQKNLLKTKRMPKNLVKPPRRIPMLVRIEIRLHLLGWMIRNVY